jgi:high-affinity nickel-transport protein
VGLKGRFLGRLGHARRPGAVALVGALFALSFDTVSQSALFALTATQFGGVWHSLFLGALFVLGMLVTDGINGLWISRLILRSDEIARVASRVIGLAVGTVSLLIAAFSGGKMLFPALDAWSEGKELAFGATVILVVFGSFLLGRSLARSAPLPAPQGDRLG